MCQLFYNTQVHETKGDRLTTPLHSICIKRYILEEKFYFGPHKEDGEWCCYEEERKNLLSSSVEIEKSIWLALVDEANSSGKLIQGDDKGYPLLVSPPAPTTEELATAIRSKRDALISSIEWRTQRYEQQTILGLTPNDSAENYEAILVYIQALRDIPEQEGFPNQVEWPVCPVEQ